MGTGWKDSGYVFTRPDGARSKRGLPHADTGLHATEPICERACAAPRRCRRDLGPVACLGRGRVRAGGRTRDRRTGQTLGPGAARSTSTPSFASMDPPAPAAPRPPGPPPSSSTTPYAPPPHAPASATRASRSGPPGLRSGAELTGWCSGSGGRSTSGQSAAPTSPETAPSPTGTCKSPARSTIWRGFIFALACPHKPQADSRNCRTSNTLATHSEMRFPSSSTSL